MGFMNGRKALLATTSAAAFGLFTLASSPAQAADFDPPAAPHEREITAVGSVYGGYKGIDDPDNVFSGDDEYPLLGGDARFNIPLGDAFNLQFDVEAEFNYQGDTATSSDDNTGGAHVGAHLNYEAVDRYLFGFFGGTGHVFQGSSTGDHESYFIGVEGQAYFSGFTLYGQVGYFDVNADGETAALNDAVFVRGVGRLYPFGPNTKLEGELGAAFGEQQNPDDDITVISWGAELEHSFANFGDSFVSGFARYAGTHVDENTAGPDEQLISHKFLLGIRISLDNQTPQGRDSYGPALDLPDFAEWSSLTVATD